MSYRSWVLEVTKNFLKGIQACYDLFQYILSKFDPLKNNFHV